MCGEESLLSLLQHLNHLQAVYFYLYLYFVCICILHVYMYCVYMAMEEQLRLNVTFEDAVSASCTHNTSLLLACD